MDAEMITTLIIVFGAIIFSMTLHEATHAFVSYWLGDDTAKEAGRLTLNPLAHIDPVTTLAMPMIMALMNLPPLGAAKPVPFDPSRLRFGDYGSALVGISGPLTNLLLATLSGLWLRFVVGIDNGLVSNVFELMVVVNIGFFVFNMIPFPPLDGSRLLFSVAPDWLRNIMYIIERQGIFGILMFFVLLFPMISPTVFNIMDKLIQLIVGVPLFT